MTDYRCPITIDRVIDGDTVVAEDVDLGYHVHIHTITYRLLRINCPEVHGDTKAAGLVATNFTAQWLNYHKVFHGGLMALSVKKDDFGRWLAEIYCNQEHNLSDALLESGNAVPFLPH